MSSNLDAHGQAIAQALQTTLETALEKLGLNLTQDSEIEEREVIEYNSRMRVFGLEKFNGPCYIFGFNFYKDSQTQEAKQTNGAFVLFFEEESIEKILKKLGHRAFDEEDEAFVLENLGVFGKQLAETFAAALSSVGYTSLLVSDPMSYKNSIPEGMDFPYSVYKYQELSLYLWDKKVVVADAIIAPA